MAFRAARRRAHRERWICHPVLAGALLLAACNDPAAPEPMEPPNIDLTLPWTKASVADVGGSAELVAAGLEKARANDRILSLLVVKNGRLVVEEYFGRAGPADLHDVRSVTKSVVSALTGIVIHRGDIGHVHSPIGGLRDSLLSDLEPEKAAISASSVKSAPE